MLLPDSMLGALQRQIDDHFYPAWGVTAELSAASDLGEGDFADYGCLIVDELDRSALGRHSLDNAGRPIAKIFGGSIVQDGGELSAVLSHEILEMLADPWGNVTVLLRHSWDQSRGDLYKLEICDAVGRSTYKIDGVIVSNFLLPAYFQVDSKGPYDFLGILSGPFSNSSGGMVHAASVSDIQPMS